MFDYVKRMPARPTNSDGAHFDMRPLTRRALMLFGLLPMLFLGYSLLVDAGGLGFGSGLRWGALAGFSVASLGWLRSLRFESRHESQPESFWEAHHQRSLSMVWRGCLIAVVVLMLGVLISALISSAFLAGLCVACLSFPLFVIAAFIDKVRTDGSR